MATIGSPGGIEIEPALDAPVRRRSDTSTDALRARPAGPCPSIRPPPNCSGPSRPVAARGTGRASGRRCPQAAATSRASVRRPTSPSPPGSFIARTGVSSVERQTSGRLRPGRRWSRGRPVRPIGLAGPGASDAVLMELVEIVVGVAVCFEIACGRFRARELRAGLEELPGSSGMGRFAGRASFSNRLAAGRCRLALFADLPLGLGIGMGGIGGRAGIFSRQFLAADGRRPAARSRRAACPRGGSSAARATPWGRCPARS